MIITIEIPFDYYNELVTILRSTGRVDLIDIIKKGRDDNYRPTKKRKKELYSEEEGSAEEEAYYFGSSTDVDPAGFLSLK